MRKKNFLLSVIIPCFNEQESIAETHRVLTETLQGTKFRYELIFVDDGSRDTTPVILGDIASKDKCSKVVFLSRNFGHQNALTAGIDYAEGDAVAFIDADLQDPPRVMLEMLEKWLEGYDVVYGQRRKRSEEGWFKLFTASLFYRLFNAISDIRMPIDTGDFRVVDRRVADILRAMPERDRFLRGMIAWVGFRQIAVLYDREARFAGVTKYPLMKMLRFAMNGILSFSNIPLKIAVWLGAASALAAALGILYTLYVRLFLEGWVSGWAFLSIVIFFFSGVQLLCLGLLGEYVGRIYRQDKRRPLYVVDRTLNHEQKTAVRNAG